jgi:hypothetical protein
VTGIFEWSPPDGQWPFDNDSAGKDWVRVRLQFVDRSGLSGSRWWSAFGDRGSNFANATEVLVRRGGSVNWGGIAMSTDFAGVTGDFKKLAGAAEVDLVATDFTANGGLCVQIYEKVDQGSPASFEYATDVCGWGNFGFGDPEGVPGRWRVGLQPGTYRLKFVDPANYYGIANVLLHNVTFASQWWTPGGRAENLRDASDLVVTAGTPLTNIAGVLRPSKQLRLDVIDIPEEVNIASLRGRITVSDDFGNWTGGTMEVDLRQRRVGANVTGLVDGRAYRIFLSFSDNNGLSRWWLIGGGTLEDATPIVPDETIIEPWQPRPLLVTMHDQVGVPYGPGEGCVVLLPLGSETPAASACTDQYGIVFLQQVPLGTYRVLAYQRDPVTKTELYSAIRLADFDVTNTLPISEVFRNYSYGLSDISRLGDGVTLSSWYLDAAAIVLPGCARCQAQ